MFTAGALRVRFGLQLALVQGAVHAAFFGQQRGVGALLHHGAIIQHQAVGFRLADCATHIEAARQLTWHAAALQRDVRDLANIEQLTEIPNLLQLLATRSGTLLNFAELSRIAGLAQSTLKRYFALLEMLFLVVRLPSWERTARRLRAEHRDVLSAVEAGDGERAARAVRDHIEGFYRETGL